MSDSEGSDYNVEEYITPAVTRHTYGKTDDSYLSEEGDFKESSGEESSNDLEIEAQCKLPNGAVSSSANKHESSSQVVEEERSEPMRANNRFILYVSNMPPDTTKQMLETLFMDCGQIKSVRIPKKRLGNFAFVEMKDIEGLKNGLKLDGKDMGEKKIRVHEGSKNKKHVSNRSKIQKRRKYEIVKDKIKKRVQSL